MFSGAINARQAKALFPEPLKVDVARARRLMTREGSLG